MSIPHILFLLSVLVVHCHPLPQQDCASFQSQGYFCVPNFLCSDAGYIHTDGGDVDQASNQAQHQQRLSARCDQAVNVCCRRADHGSHASEDIRADHGSNAGSDTRAEQKLKRSCGIRNEHGVGRNTQSPSAASQLEQGDSKFGEWPHVCAIIVIQNGNGIFTCAGSMISKEVVLTAAHSINEAFKNKEVIKIRCGDWDLKNRDEEFSYQTRTVDKVVIHPDFDEKTIENNFALLFTKKDFDLYDAQHMSPVCLPHPGERLNREDCVSNGWGKDKFGDEGHFQVRLKEIHLPIINRQECETRLKKTRLGPFFELDDSFICAGGERGIDTCKGDGGAPLICRHDESDSWVQTGIVSWGIGCGEDIPAVYANVAKAACWIDREVTCYLHASSAATFSAAASNNDVPSYFGFQSEDCPEEPIGNCIDINQKNYEDNDDDAGPDDNSEEYYPF